MIRSLLLAAALALSLPVFSQSLTRQQLTTLCTAVKASPTANAARLAGDTTSLTAWLNSARTPQTLAWGTAVSKSIVDEAPSYTSYDTLSTGKRDSWTRFLDAPSRDFTKNKIRNWVVDVWGNATAGSNAEAILQAATRDSTNAQFALGGTSRTTGTVTALDLAYPFNVPSSPPNAPADWLVVSANCNG